MAVNINLYPPVVETYMPAFLIGSSDSQKNICKVYFSISLYNSYNDIKNNVQVTVSNQNTNLSVLDKKKYPCEIMLTTLKTDLTRTSSDKYYIEILTSDIEGGFQINQYYKVQIRFTADSASSLPAGIGMPPTNWDPIDEIYTDAQAIDSWLATNVSNFSEWSTVCLVRGISVPSLSITGFDPSADTTIWSLNNVDVIGKLTFADENETDTLKSYQIKLYDSNNNLLSDSGLLYSNIYSGVNEFNYTFEYIFNEGETYSFIFNYETANLYSENVEYEFIIVQEATESFVATLKPLLNEVDGAIALNVQSSMFNGTLTFRRTSSESNFTKWEDIYTIYLNSGSNPLDYTWTDYTIKSGIYYKYLIQKRNSLGQRSIAVYMQGDPVMILFDDMYLTGDNEQLNVRFDPSITSFQVTVSESRTDTIGSKYPYVKKNGAIEYKQFPISGTITHLMDPSHLITSKEEIFRDSLPYYEEYNNNKYIRIDDMNDWTYEREFREKVKDFLHANKVRLFRSATEGNILIKLMDIKFTPNAVLGRRIYSFSAMAYEIDECTIKNYKKYNILPSTEGSYSTPTQFNSDYIGQYTAVIPASTEVLSLIEAKYEKYAKEHYTVEIQNLDYLRLEFQSKPYLIKEGLAGPYVVDDIGSTKENPSSAILGYLVYINNKPIIINPEGIYELKGDDIEITSLSFPIATEVNIDYHVNIAQIEDTSTIFQTTSFYRKVGQQWGTFKPNEGIHEKIWNKYFENYSNYQQVMLSLDGIKIEADPGTIVYIKESADTNFERHIIGDTHTLVLDAEDSAIEGIYFGGVHLEPATAEEQGRENMPSNKYIETGIIIDKNVDKQQNFIKNGVYSFGDDCLEILTEHIGDNGQAIISSNDLIHSDEKHYRDNRYSVKSKQQWPAKSTASVINNSMSKEDSVYTLTLERVYDQFNTVILKQVIDETTGKFIWYNDEWWAFTENHDLLCPVNALIDYHCEIMKGRFAE